MKAEEIYEQGVSLEKSGHYIHAALKYVTALRLDIRLHNAYYKIGAILSRYNKYLEAVYCFKQVNNLPALEECFKKLDEIYPNNPYVSEIKGDCYNSPVVS